MVNCRPGTESTCRFLVRFRISCIIEFISRRWLMGTQNNGSMTRNISTQVMVFLGVWMNSKVKCAIVVDLNVDQQLTRLKQITFRRNFVNFLEKQSTLVMSAWSWVYIEGTPVKTDTGDQSCTKKFKMSLRKHENVREQILCPKLSLRQLKRIKIVSQFWLRNKNHKRECKRMMNYWRSCLSNFTGFLAWLTIVSIAIFQVDHRYFLHIRQFHSVDYLALFSIFVEKQDFKGIFIFCLFDCQKGEDLFTREIFV